LNFQSTFSRTSTPLPIQPFFAYTVEAKRRNDVQYKVSTKTCIYH